MAVKTVCPYCGVGCGILAEARDGQVTVKGDPDHPANFGRLCSKGAALGETLDLEGRLLTPMVDGKPATWESAIEKTARAFREAIDAHGPDSVAIYASGQMLTEDYYVANKLMKGFIGSANIDTNSRLCMASTVAGHIRAFGSDTVPGVYEDLELADLVVLVGSNLAWCHPVLYQRIAAAKQARPGMRVVNIDPRRTATSDLADISLSIAPGGDLALFAGLLDHLARTGRIDADYCRDHVSGLTEALAAASEIDLSQTGLTAPELQAFYDLWAGTEKVVTVFSQGVNQAIDGTDKVNAILNVHLATGRIGRPGMGPFSVTGQPNAMGGREVGGLATMLAAHLDIANPQHRAALQNFWQSPAMASRPGLKAVDLFRACREGKIKVLWIISTNPAVTLPEADSVRDAIRACPFVAVSDITAETDTAPLADVLFPAAGWGEKSGTVTNSERRISRQRAFLPVPGAVRPDWRILCDVAAAMGWGEAFAYDRPADIFREYAALTGLSARFGRDLDLTGLVEADYDAIEPVQWPRREGGDGGGGGGRFFAEGGFFTPDRRARMIPSVATSFARATSTAFPLRLNTGRVRDQWHTMTRSAKSPRLNRHTAEPYVEIHPDDAAEKAIAPADLVQIENPYGRVVARALITENTPRGSIFLPMHWNGHWASAGRADALVPGDTDPHSGQPALKASVARIEKLAVAWYGFAVCHSRFDPTAAYWARARSGGGWQAELAGTETPDDWIGYARALFGLHKDVSVLSAMDATRGTARVAFHTEGRLQAALFAAPEPVAVSRSFVADALKGPARPADILAGRPGAGRPDSGPIVCSCFDVGVNTILAAIADRGLVDIDAIGAALGAGTNCGSCRPELSGLLMRSSPSRVAAE